MEVFTLQFRVYIGYLKRFTCKSKTAIGTTYRIRLINIDFSPVKCIEHITIRKIKRHLRILFWNLSLMGFFQKMASFFSEKAISVLASPRLLLERNGGNGIRGLFTASEPNKSGHRWNVLSMQKQPTMQTEKFFYKLQAQKYSNFSLKEWLQHLWSLGWKSCGLTKRFQWLLLASMWLVLWCGKVKVLGGCSTCFILHFHLFFVTVLQTV